MRVLAVIVCVAALLAACNRIPPQEYDGYSYGDTVH